MYVGEHFKYYCSFVFFLQIILKHFLSEVFSLQDGTIRLQAGFHGHSGDGLSCIWYVFQINGIFYSLWYIVYIV